MIRFLLLTLLSLSIAGQTWAVDAPFAVAAAATPVLNTPDFRAVFGGSDGNTLQMDECGQLRALEFVALPGTVFTVAATLERHGQKIFRVTTADYPYPTKSGYYIDARFVTLLMERPPERTAVLPSRKEIIASLRSMAGSRYVWGGNVSAGVAELLTWYPPATGSTLNPGEKNPWMLTGVDCSGLLYAATGGYTPRNTSALTTYGTAVSVAGKNAATIAALLEPLDLLVWNGHVLIVIDGGAVIESRLVCADPANGVRIRPLVEALSELMQRRKPVIELKNSQREFVVRRWFGQANRKIAE